MLLEEETMEKLGVFSGDLVEISGGRRTVAYCNSNRSFGYRMPTTGHKEAKDAIWMNALTRHNAETRLGDHVTVKKVEARMVSKVALVPVYPAARAVMPGDLERNSNPIVVVPGDALVTGTYMRRQFVQVVGTTPISDKTVGNISYPPAGERGTTRVFADGGQTSRDSPSGDEAYIFYPMRTEIEILDPPSANVGLGTENFAEMPRFPPFWMDNGFGGRSDPAGGNKYLSLSFVISHYDGGHANASIDVKISEPEQKQKAGVFDFTKMLPGLREASTGQSRTTRRVDSPMQHLLGSLGALGGIYSYSAPYIEEAAKIVEQANAEWKAALSNGARRPTPTDVKFRILKKWSQM